MNAHRRRRRDLIELAAITTGLPPPARAELSADARHAAGGRPGATIAEALAMVTLGARLRVRRATDDDPERMIRQGAWFGAAGLLLALTASGTAAATHQGSGMSVILGVLAAAAILAPPRWGVLLTVTAGVLATSNALRAEDVAGATDSRVLAAMALVAAAALLAARRPRTRSAPVWVALAGSAAAGVVIGPATQQLVSAATLAAPLGGLLASRLDPRLAAAAVVLWSFRLLAFMGSGDPLPPVVVETLARGGVMVAGMAFAVAVTRAAIRRTAAR